MALPSLSRTTIGLAVVGAAVAGAWVALAGGPELAGAVGRLPASTGAALLALTAACVGLRFLRWQFLLRQRAVRIPTRRSLSIYVASLVGILTPAYLGETLRCALLRREFGVPVRRTLPVWVAERLLDGAAVALLGAAAAGGGWALAGAAGAALLLCVVPVPAGERPGGPAGRLRLLLPALALSLIAWLPAALLIPTAARGMGLAVGTAEGVRTFAAATLAGAASLMPAGMAATGSAAIVALRDAGLSGLDAVALTSVFRLASAGVTLVVAGVVLARELRRRAAGGSLHFDRIAGEYLDQFRPHIWRLLLERKTRLIRSALPAPERAGTGLDLGCGLGHQARALTGEGFRVVGLDPAHELLRHARAGGVSAVTGDALRLPFADGSLDWVYTVGVLHHLPGRDAQARAIAEVMRVLRPGGVLVVHETNPLNPLFRLYMGYLFPLLRSIDEGVEHWIAPARWDAVPGGRRVRTEHFTFLPDFLPERLLRWALPLERRLERSRLRTLSVHYMAVVRREPEGAASSEEGWEDGSAAPGLAAAPR